MDSVVQLLNETYKGCVFMGMERVQGAYKGIAHDKHGGDFLLLRFLKNDKEENILLCEGKENFINIYPFEQTKRLLVETKYTSHCKDEDSESLNEFCLQYLNQTDEESGNDDESEYTASTMSSSADESE